MYYARMETDGARARARVCVCVCTVRTACTDGPVEEGGAVDLVERRQQARLCQEGQKRLGVILPRQDRLLGCVCVCVGGGRM
jgi:hypothetical protein